MKDPKIGPPINAEARAVISVPDAAKLPKEGALVVFTTNNPKLPKVDILVTVDKGAFEERMHGKWSGQK